MISVRHTGILVLIVVLISTFVAGMYWQRLLYEDRCQTAGGAHQLGRDGICVVTEDLDDGDDSDHVSQEEIAADGERVITGIVTEFYDDRSFDGNRGVVVDGRIRVDIEHSGFGGEQETGAVDLVEVGDNVEIYGRVHETPFIKDKEGGQMDVFAKDYYMRKL